MLKEFFITSQDTAKNFAPITSLFEQIPAGCRHQFVEREFAKGVRFPAMLTGSSVYGYSIPRDVDYLVPIDPAAVAYLKKIGWQEGGSEAANAASEFVSLKAAHINLIVGKTPEFIERFVSAHNYALLTQGEPRKKADILKIFAAFHANNEPPND